MHLESAMVNKHKDKLKPNRNGKGTGIVYIDKINLRQ